MLKPVFAVQICSTKKHLQKVKVSFFNILFQKKKISEQGNRQEIEIKIKIKLGEKREIEGSCKTRQMTSAQFWTTPKMEQERPDFFIHSFCFYLLGQELSYLNL